MKRKIGFRLGIWFSLLAVLSAGVTGYYAYQESRDIVVSGAEDRLLTATSVLTRRFTGALEEIARDVQLLAKLPFVRVITLAARDTDMHPGQKSHVAEIFKSMLHEHGEYFQIRLIGAADHGRELIRVDREADGLQWIQEESLQEKAHYPYVFRTLRKPPGSLYVSRININRESGDHTGFSKPTIRIATPIHGDDGMAAGLIVINVVLEGLMHSMGEDLPAGLLLYLTNEKGDFLIHPEGEKSFGFDFGRRFLIQDEFPLTEALLNDRQQQLVLTTEGAGQGGGLVAAFVRLPFGRIAADRFALLGLAAPLAEVYSDTMVLGRNVLQIVIGGSMLAVLLAFMLSRALSRPLLQLVSAVGTFPAKLNRDELPLKRADEIGLLARTVMQLTDQIQQQLQMLEQSERRLNRAQKTARIGNWEADLATKKVQWSDQQYRLLGFVPGAIEPTMAAFLRAVHPRDRHQVVESVRMLLQGGIRQGRLIEHRLLLPDGSIRVVEERGEVHYDDRGKAIRVFGTTLDITRRKTIEEELRFSHQQLQDEATKREELIDELESKNAELERFTYTVSHDLKSPLVTVNGFLGLLGQDVASGDKALVERDIAQIKNATQQMGRLLDELLELSRIGRISNAPEAVSLESLALEAYDLLRGSIESHGARISIDPDLPLVYADRQRMKEVMQNLLDNALKFRRPNECPSIRISAKRRLGEVICCITDNGIGVEPRYHERVFELFERLDPRVEGTGVGLALVKRILEVQNGRVWIEQGDGGQGTSVCFALPEVRNGSQG